MEYTKEIETPVGKHKVKFKTMLTGFEREEVETAPTAFVDTTDGETYNVKDMKQLTLAQRHTLLKVSLLSIDGDETNCFDRVRKMYAPDYTFVCDEIEKEQKKVSGLTLDSLSLSPTDSAGTSTKS